MMLLRLSETSYIFDSWAQLLTWYSTNTDQSMRALRNIAVQAIIYNLWADKNNKIFKNQMSTTLDLFKLVDKTVRNTFLSTVRNTMNVAEIVGINKKNV